MKKNFINLAMVAMVAVGTVAYTGCGKKGCTTEADDKFDSAATESDPEACDPDATVAKFVGTYAVAEGCGANTDSYNITIAASSSTEYGIVISNFYNVGTSVSGTVKQSDFTIDSQSLGSYTVTGSGSLSGTAITINYTITGGGNSVTCSATGSKL